jgi:chromosome segregation ATPase
VTETQGEITELEAAHAANGRLLAELEQLRTRLAHANAARRTMEDAYYEQKRRVSELEGAGAKNKLLELAGMIVSEQKRLDVLVERKKRAQKSVQELQDVTDAYSVRMIEIMDGIG